MQVQIVRASTRHRALAEARRLIGPDPLVLSVRRRPGSRGGEEWEAIVARDTPEPFVVTPEEPAPEAPAELSPDRSELEGLRREIAGLRESLGSGRSASTELLTLAHRLTQLEGQLAASALRGEDISPRWAPLVRRLEAAGYPRTEALRIVQSVDLPTEESSPDPDWSAYSARIRQVLAEGIEVAPANERLEPGLVVFAGSAGVGKTTLAAKLAADLSLGGAASPTLGVLKPRKGVGLETVRRCAGALGIDFVEVTAPEQLTELASRSKAAPVILDSPAINPLDDRALGSFREFLAAAPSAEVHAVVSACYGDGELSRSLDAFSWAPKRRVSATHLDEAPYVGRVMAAASRARVPIGYLSLGPRIPDDLARPGIESLVDSVLQAEGAFAS
ncbi:MAG: hypothetical protein AAFZ18_29250 [Myxococcota bacterium]